MVLLLLLVDGTPEVEKGVPLAAVVASGSYRQRCVLVVLLHGGGAGPDGPW